MCPRLQVPPSHCLHCQWDKEQIVLLTCLPGVPLLPQLDHLQGMPSLLGGVSEQGLLQGVDDCDVKCGILGVYPVWDEDVGWSGLSVMEKVPLFLPWCQHSLRCHSVYWRHEGDHV